MYVLRFVGQLISTANVCASAVVTSAVALRAIRETGAGALRLAIVSNYWWTISAKIGEGTLLPMEVGIVQ